MQNLRGPIFRQLPHCKVAIAACSSHELAILRDLQGVQASIMSSDFMEQFTTGTFPYAELTVLTASVEPLGIW